MKKKITLSLILVVSLLTGCGKTTETQKILEDAKIKNDGLILTEAQFVKAQEEKPDKVSYVKTEYATKQEENLLALFDKLRELGFTRDNYEISYSETNGIKDNVTELSVEEQKKRDQDIIENLEVYFTEDDYNDLGLSLVYTCTVEGKTGDEIIAKAKEIFSSLENYGITVDKKVFDGMKTGSYAFSSQNGIQISIGSILEEEEAQLKQMSIGIGVSMSRLYAPEKYNELISRLIGSRYEMMQCSIGGPMSCILLENREWNYYSGNSEGDMVREDCVEHIRLCLVDQKIFRIDLEMPENFLKKYKITMSDGTKETVRACLTELMNDEKLADEFIEKMRTKLSPSGTFGDYSWEIKGSALSIYHS